jgi:hypothetical protein
MSRAALAPFALANSAARPRWQPPREPPPHTDHLFGAKPAEADSIVAGARISGYARFGSVVLLVAAAAFGDGLSASGELGVIVGMPDVEWRAAGLLGGGCSASLVLPA